MASTNAEEEAVVGVLNKRYVCRHRLERVQGPNKGRQICKSIENGPSGNQPKKLQKNDG